MQRDSSCLFSRMKISCGATMTVVLLAFIAHINAADQNRYAEGGARMNVEVDQSTARKKIHRKLWTALHADKLQEFAKNYREKMTPVQRERTKVSKRESSSRRYLADMEILDNLEEAKAQAVTLGDVERIAQAERRAEKKKASTAKWLETKRSDAGQCAILRVNNKVRKLAKAHMNSPMTESAYTKEIGNFISREKGTEGVSDEELRKAAWKTWKSFKPRAPYKRRGKASSSTHERVV